MPVRALHQVGQQRFVLGRIRLEVRERVLIQVDVRPRVIAQRIARLAPRFQSRNIARMLLNCEAVDEAVDWRHVRVVHRGENLGNDLDARFARWQRRMRGKIVEGERDLRWRCRS